MRTPLLPVALLALMGALLSGCQGPRRTPVQRQAGIEGAWRTEQVIVRTKGETAVIHYKDHTFEIQHFGHFHGYLEKDLVLLRGSSFEILVTEDIFQAGYKNGTPKTWRLSTIPKGKVAVFDGFDLRFP